MQRAETEIVRRKSCVSGGAPTAENVAPLAVPAAEGAILRVGIHRGGKRDAGAEHRGVLAGHGQCPETAHRIACNRAVACRRTSGKHPVNHRNELIHQHVHIIESAVVAVYIVGIPSLWNHVDNRTGLTGRACLGVDIRYVEMTGTPCLGSIAIAMQQIDNGKCSAAAAKIFLRHKHTVAHLAAELGALHGLPGIPARGIDYATARRGCGGGRRGRCRVVVAPTGSQCGAQSQKRADENNFQTFHIDDRCEFVSVYW